MTRSDFLAGLRSGLVVAASSGPFALLFGAVAVDNGLSVLEAGLMSAAIFGGASQLVGVELFGHYLPAWLIVLSVLAVNFRHVLYSASAAPLFERYPLGKRLLSFFFLTDPQYADMIRRSETKKSTSFGWYLTSGIVVYVTWVTMTVVGAWFGGLLGDPKTIALDALLPIYFLGLVVGFRRRRNFYPIVLASAAGAIAAFHLVGSPWHVSIGALCGIVVAVVLTPNTPPQPRTEIVP